MVHNCALHICKDNYKIDPKAGIFGDLSFMLQILRILILSFIYLFIFCHKIHLIFNPNVHQSNIEPNNLDYVSEFGTF